jgi:large subunit ribosomal protein L2
MGKKLRVQRRGRGTPTFRGSKKNKISPVKYPELKIKKFNGSVSKLLHESGRGAPVAYIEFEEGTGYYTPAIEGLYIGQQISYGNNVPVSIGNIVSVGLIPEGTMVCNVELRPGDGGRIARSSGSYATIISHSPGGTTIRLPSKKTVRIKSDCRATIGVVSGGGRKEKPFMKAGEKFYLKKAKGQVYPVTKGVKMTSASHPHGGGRHRRPGKSTTVSRHAPPGKKVGLIAARSSGKKKRQRKK